MGLLHVFVKFKCNLFKKKVLQKKEKNREESEKLKVTSIDSLQYPSTLQLTLKQHFFEVDTSLFPAIDEATSSERSLL